LYVPPNVHKAIQWNSADTFNMDDYDNIDFSKLISTGDLSSLDTLPSSSADQQLSDISATKQITHQRLSLVIGTLYSSSKHKTSGSIPQSILQKKKRNFSPLHASLSNNSSISPFIGTQWSNNSCAYDAVVTILYSV